MGLRRDMAEGTLTASGSAVNILCGFKPKYVHVVNTTSKTSLLWSDAMGEAAAYKSTGASVANIASPLFSGTGQSSSGQVITTTDNQTMTLNQCAGMWFVSATHGPYLIASNTAVVGAPAVLTIYGTAPTTDAGTYKILRALSSSSLVASNGISTVFNGFTFGADSDVNVAAATIYWTAWK